MRAGSNLLSYTPDAGNGYVSCLHLARPTITTQLQTMFANGQRTVRLPICFYRGSTDSINLDSTGAAFPQQALQNFKDLLSLLTDTGFEDIQIALMPQAQNSFWNWSSWSEDFYQENWNLIAITLMELMAPVSVPCALDLNNELTNGLIPNAPGTAMAAEYRQRLWGNYAFDARLPLNKTVGFSIDPTPLAFQQAPSIYRGKLPTVMSVHIYRGVPSVSGWGSAYDTFKGVHVGLSGLGYNGAVRIDECGYNDPEIAREFTQGSKDTGRGIALVNQWPIDARLPLPQDSSQNVIPLDCAYLNY